MPDHNPNKKKIKVRGESIAAPTMIAIFLIAALTGWLIYGKNYALDKFVADAAPSGTAPAYVEARSPEQAGDAAAPLPDTTPAVHQTPESSLSPSENTPMASLLPDSDSTTAPVPDLKKYEIDTVASDLLSFRSMIIDNHGTVYYINGSEICSTADSKKLSLDSSFDANPYLAYDPYNDIVYLLVNEPLTVYDISDFNAPELVMDQETCPDLHPEKGSGGKLEHASGVTSQIPVLADGTLLVPTEGIKKIWMLNPKTQTAAPTTAMSAGRYDMTRLLGDDVMSLNSGSTSAERRPFGSSEGSEITLEVEAPRNNANSVIARNSLVYFYDSASGLCAIAADGSANVLISKSEIEVKDGQGLDAPNIWCLDVNQDGVAAFYDNTLKSIRRIAPT